MDKEFFIKNKKKIIIVVAAIAVSLIGFSLLNSTYSLFYHEETSKNTEGYSTGTLSITASSKGSTISLSDALPVEDSVGSTSTPYTFTITNTGNLNYKFNIKLLSTGSSSTTIGSQYIKLKVDDGSVTTLSSLSNGIIKKDVTLAAGESIDISVRVWLSISTPNSQIGKTFNSKIVIDGQAVYTKTNLVSSLFTPDKVVTNNSINYQYDTTHNLMKDVGGNIRYYGAEPNNYIYFNCSDYSNQSSSTCETWRIIGVFNGKVKLIRGSEIGEYSWDNKDTSTGAESAYGKNDWTDARLMKLLNPGYESETTGGSLYYNSGSGNCYAGENNTTKACDFTSTGIKNNTTRSLISNTIYYLGGWNDSEIYSNQIYSYERATTVYAGRPTTWQGKIALPYPSDYSYAVDLNQCKEKILHNSDGEPCTSNNWMKRIVTKGNETYGWLLTPNSSISYAVWIVDAYGSVYPDNSADFAYGVTPVLYLNSEVDIKSGTGSSSNPYQLDVS